MKKVLTEALIILGCVVLLCGCKGKANQGGQSNGTDITKKTGQDSFVLLPTDSPSVGSSEDGEENREVLENEGDAQAEADIRYELASMLPFEEGDDKICAIAYMGNNGVAHEENLTAFYSKYFPSIESDNWLVLPEFNCGGGECYLVIPRYRDSVAYVNFLNTTLDGTIGVEKSEVVEHEAFLVYCNVSPEFANSEVHFLYGESQFVVVPRLSAVDGRIEPQQVAMDLTMDTVYEQ